MEPTKYVVRIFGKTRDGKDYNGSGFLLTPQGHVATCWHVVEKAADIFVKLPYTKEWLYDVLDKHEEEDFAVLVSRVPPIPETYYATIHRDVFKSIKVGDEVYGWGYADSDNVDAALQIKSTISGTSGKYGLIILDGSINSGDSGGPLVNMDGKVIGIINYKDQVRDGHAMARPISGLFKLLDEKNIQIGRKAGEGSDAKRAIDDLPDLRREPSVNAAIQAYSGVFEKASQQITILTNYKQVHDLLHNVQYSCYYSLVLGVRGMLGKDWEREDGTESSLTDNQRPVAEDGQAWGQISVILTLMSDYISDADDIIEEAIERRERIREIRGLLKNVRDALQEAYQHQNKQQCARALRLLRSLILGTEPSNFNGFLNTAARKLDMDNLIAGMTGVYNAVIKAKLENAKAEVIQLGVKDLIELKQDLQAHIEEHDVWQTIDDSLNTTLNKRTSVVVELEVLWPILNPRLQSVCKLAQPVGECGDGATLSDWAAQIIRQTKSLESALSLRQEDETHRQLNQLYHQTAQRFNKVDKDLLKICERIGKMKDPLQRFAEAMQ